MFIRAVEIVVNLAIAEYDIYEFFLIISVFLYFNGNSWLLVRVAKPEVDSNSVRFEGQMKLLA